MCGPVSGVFLSKPDALSCPRPGKHPSPHADSDLQQTEKDIQQKVCECESGVIGIDHQLILMSHGAKPSEDKLARGPSLKLAGKRQLSNS